MADVKQDWAEKIARHLEVGIEGQGPEQFVAAMSVNLRKAKADGMRQAANWCADQAKQWKGVPEAGIEHGIQNSSALILRVNADKIEKGEANG